MSNEHKKSLTKKCDHSPNKTPINDIVWCLKKFIYFEKVLVTILYLYTLIHAMNDFYTDVSL